MASRDIGGSIQAALKDLFDERDIVEDAISKLQSLLEGIKTSATPKRRGRPAGSRNKKVTRKAVTKKKVGRPAKKSKAGWTPAARKEAADRMKKYWANRKKKKKVAPKGAKRRGRPPGKKAGKRK